MNWLAVGLNSPICMRGIAHRLSIGSKLVYDLARAVERVQHALLVHVPAAATADVPAISDWCVDRPGRAALRIDAADLVARQPVERLAPLADGRTSWTPPQSGSPSGANWVDGFHFALPSDPQNPVAMLVDAVEITAGSGFHVQRRVPAHVVADAEIVRGRNAGEIRIVQIHRMIEVGVGRGDHAARVGGGIVDGVNDFAALFFAPVQRQAEHEALALSRAGQVRPPIPAHRQPRAREQSNKGDSREIT